MDTASYNTVARWQAAKSMWHNGSYGVNYAETFIVPPENAAMFVMLSAEGAPYRMRTMNKVYAELAALRLHHGDATDIIMQSKKGTVSITRALSISSNAITDGRISTKWSAPSGMKTPTITITYSEPVALDRIVVIEDEGNNIQQYQLEYQDVRGAWHIVAKNTVGKDLIFPHRIFDVPKLPQSPVLGQSNIPQATKIRFKVLKSSLLPPRIVEIAAANLSGRAYKPLWWRHGFTEALAPKGPILDPGPKLPVDKVTIQPQM